MYQSIRFTIGFTLLLLATSPVHAGDKESEIFLSCGGTTGGDPERLVICVSGALAQNEINNFFQGKALGCENSIRQLFRGFDSACQSQSIIYDKPKLKFLVPYRTGFIIGYTNYALYYSRDGQNLNGGGNTILAYSGQQEVRKIIPYKNWVITAFSGGRIYVSPDGKNLGGGGDTARDYYDSNSNVISLETLYEGVKTCFIGNTCYFSPNGRNLGGGGSTELLPNPIRP